jgi:NADPH2:quinone reductase
VRAVWYERTGPAEDVLAFGEQPMRRAGPGQARVRLAASGVNPSDRNPTAIAAPGPAIP